jgi:predicted phage terminase large subunit-like protein
MNFSRDLIDWCVPDIIPIDEPLWPFKHDEEELRVISVGDPYTFSSQYQQKTIPDGGGMFKDKYWKHYEVLPSDITVIKIFGDTAQKTKERNDYTVFQCWGFSPSSGIYLIDQTRGKWEAPQLESELVEFWNKHKPTLYKRQGVQCVKIEDKSSGSSLIQSIKQNYLIPIEPIQRNTDKVLRAMGVVKFFASGYIHLPVGADWLHDYKNEFRKFTPMMTHKNDDQIDATMDAVEDLIVFDQMIYNTASI